MSRKIYKFEPDFIVFHCPGCDTSHAVTVGPGKWTWNGSLESPTFNPSILTSSTNKPGY